MPAQPFKNCAEQSEMTRRGLPQTPIESLNYHCIESKLNKLTISYFAIFYSITKINQKTYHKPAN